MKVMYSVMLVFLSLLIGCSNDKVNFKSNPEQSISQTSTDAKNENNPLNAPKILSSRLSQILDKPEKDITLIDIQKITDLDLNGESIEPNKLNAEVYDLSLVAQMKKLQHLYIAHIPMKDLSFISSINQLEALSITQFNMDDLPSMNNLPKLTYLSLNQANIKNLYFLNKVNPNLKILNLSENQIVDISNTKQFKELTSLDITDNPISDIYPIQTLTKIERLQVQKTLVNDLTVLKTLHALKYLDIRETKVSSVAPLSNLELLNIFLVNKGNISDLNALDNNKNLRISEKTILDSEY